MLGDCVNHSGKTKTAYLGSKYSKYTTAQDPQMIVPQSVLFVEEICEIISTSFPDLWKLGQAYFSGELQVKVEPGRQTGFKVIYFLHFVYFREFIFNCF